MLRSIFAPALDTSTDNSTFCAATEGAVRTTPIRAKLARRARMTSESFRPERGMAGRNKERKTGVAWTRLRAPENRRFRQWILVLILEASVEVNCSAPEI